MRWMRASIRDRLFYGIVEGETLVEVEGTPFGEYRTTGVRHALDALRIETPVTPPTFYAVGFNYTEHILKVAARTGQSPALPTQPDVGQRSNNSLTAHGQPVVIPADATDAVQYEGELVAVIGRKAKGLSEAEALSCVLGYTIGNDVSERTWQKTDRTLWRAKSPDTWAPMGPWIETDADLDAMETIVRVNGEETTRFRTNSMLFGVARFISTMSLYMTLYPGDVIWMGTDGASPNLKAGDIVDIEITGIGHLTNPFVAEAR